MFFDVSAAVLVFITMGKYFEERSKGAASSAIQALLGHVGEVGARHPRRRRGRTADRAGGARRHARRAAGREACRSTASCARATSTIDESMITGESIPVERRAGRRGHRRHDQPERRHRVEATAVGAATTLGAHGAAWSRRRRARRRRSRSWSTRWRRSSCRSSS